MNANDLGRVSELLVVDWLKTAPRSLRAWQQFAARRKDRFGAIRFEPLTAIVSELRERGVEVEEVRGFDEGVRTFFYVDSGRKTLSMGLDGIGATAPGFDAGVPDEKFDDQGRKVSRTRRRVRRGKLA